MSKLTKALTAAAGNAGGDPLYVEDVFSTYLYTGNNTGTNTQNIVNGIDLAGKGGAVWIKTRNVAWNHGIWDTETDGGNLYTNTTDAQQSNDDLASFNSDGFGVSSAVGTGWYNFNDQPQVSWTFRKAEKFFDVVTWTGDGAAGPFTLPHNLGATVGMSVVKVTSHSGDWITNHRSLPSNYLALNSTAAAQTDVTMTSTDSTITFNGSNVYYNFSGRTYVAYLFASDAGGFGDDGSESIIKCGSYTGTGSDGNFINLGYEPQWIMIKKTNEAYNWSIFDNMRGVATGGDDAILYANTSDAEVTPANVIDFNATGFTANTAYAWTNDPGDSYIYIAIRRPMKTPESGTEVFKATELTSPYGKTITTGWPVDMTLHAEVSSTGNRQVIDRLRGTSSSGPTNYLSTNANTAEASFASYGFGYDSNEGYLNNLWGGTDGIFYDFKRATGFFDVVAYTGNGSTRTINHNLGVAPEMMIIKARESLSPYEAGWVVYHSGISPQDSIYLSQNGGSSGASFQFASTSPTSSVFTLGSAIDVNMTGKNFISYHFATLAGVSKVGSYTGTGSNVDVDCGFSAGARFILIKRTDSTGDWYVWDSVRGIVAGNDPYLLLNSTAAEVTSTDYIDPLSSGFTVTSSAPAALNASGGTYIYLSIA